MTQAPDSTGTIIGDCSIVRALGTGAFGTVYEARHVPTGLRVALKTLHSRVGDEAGERALLRFLQEARAVQRIQHRNVVRLYEAGDYRLTGQTRLAYFAMELVDGVTLASVVESDGPIDLAVACRIVAQAALGLQASHDAGVIHRDVKPSNIMLDRTGRSVVMDFGLCRLPESRRLTSAGMMVGTLRYGSAEMLTGEEPDGRMDVFGLGAVLFYLCTGTHLRSENTIPGLVEVVRNDLDRQRVTTCTMIPNPLRGLLGRCVAVDPRERVATCRELAAALDDAADTLASHRLEAPVLPTVLGTAHCLEARATPLR